MEHLLRGRCNIGTRRDDRRVGNHVPLPIVAGASSGSPCARGVWGNRRRYGPPRKRYRPARIRRMGDGAGAVAALCWGPAGRWRPRCPRSRPYPPRPHPRARCLPQRRAPHHASSRAAANPSSVATAARSSRAQSGVPSARRRVPPARSGVSYGSCYQPQGSIEPRIERRS